MHWHKCEVTTLVVHCLLTTASLQKVCTFVWTWIWDVYRSENKCTLIAVAMLCKLQCRNRKNAHALINVGAFITFLQKVDYAFKHQELCYLGPRPAQCFEQWRAFVLTYLHYKWHCKRRIKARDYGELIIQETAKERKMLVFHPGLGREVGIIGSSPGHFDRRGIKEGKT